MSLYRSLKQRSIPDRPRSQLLSTSRFSEMHGNVIRGRLRDARHFCVPLCTLSRPEIVTPIHKTWISIPAASLVVSSGAASIPGARYWPRIFGCWFRLSPIIDDFMPNTNTVRYRWSRSSSAALSRPAISPLAPAWAHPLHVVQPRNCTANLSMKIQTGYVYWCVDTNL